MYDAVVHIPESSSSNCGIQVDLTFLRTCLRVLPRGSAGLCAVESIEVDAATASSTAETEKLANPPAMKPTIEPNARVKG